MADYTVSVNQVTKDYVTDFCLKVQKGKTVEFKAITGKFTINFRNADKFFANPVGPKLTLNIDSGANSGIDPNWPFLTILNNLSVDTEIKYEVCFISAVPPDWADAPPRIIVVP